MEKEISKNKNSGLIKMLYLVSAILTVVFVYMFIVNVIYINNYIASYGMTISDMWMEAIQYVVTGSISYLVYAILVFCAGKVIRMLSDGSKVRQDDAVEPKEKSEEESFEPEPKKPEPRRKKRMRRTIK